MLCNKVVFPVPKNPDKTVIGIGFAFWFAGLLLVVLLIDVKAVTAKGSNHKSRRVELDNFLIVSFAEERGKE